MLLPWKSKRACVGNLAFVCMGVGARVRACAYARVAFLIPLPRTGAIFTATCLASTNFSTKCHKRHDFQKEVTEHKLYILIFSTNFI
jgi:hypothetical protein